MVWPILIVSVMLFVAYANGANDNFKGVATLFGSGTTDYRRALWWATLTTLAGSVTALFIATKLISIFQKKDFLPESLTQSQPFVAAVILGAALTVFLATKIGIPISTTHVSCGLLRRALWHRRRERPGSLECHPDDSFSMLLTLPTAALFAGLIYTVLVRLEAI